jgi:hypothetical protein
MKDTVILAEARSAAVQQQTLDELKAIRRELAAILRLFDHFADVFLNAKFRHGKATDRWARRG